MRDGEWGMGNGEWGMGNGEWGMKEREMTPKFIPHPSALIPHVNWSGREDLNLRPPAPKAGALPGCATPRRPAACRVRSAPTILLAEKPAGCLERQAAVAHAGLLPVRELGERSAERRIEEDWILAVISAV